MSPQWAGPGVLLSGGRWKSHARLPDPTQLRIERWQDGPIPILRQDYWAKLQRKLCSSLYRPIDNVNEAHGIHKWDDLRWKDKNISFWVVHLHLENETKTTYPILYETIIQKEQHPNGMSFKTYFNIKVM